ncbi:hypothetical protein DM860_016201 [Cuscuta australis]|uniref:Histone chaperone domain-containing protein n=1 Tax=Cuscuta australis TaxID=267555 RepID=A0A328DRW1_9ASTE|nr:hypothetical protein DM860_016201 [Cuscuta australis]
MVEARNDEEECALPVKRKPDTDLLDIVTTESLNDDSSKKAKHEKFVAGVVSSNPDVKLIAEKSVSGVFCTVNDEEDEDDEEDFQAGEEAEVDDEFSSGEAENDRKGKAIASNYKGKGKLIEESFDDSESDSSSFESESGTDSESLSDDPLAEVDLDNILPSRTRRRNALPGFSIFPAAAGKAQHDSDGDDRSDA